jgi:hypothetical protein
MLTHITAASNLCVCKGRRLALLPVHSVLTLKPLARENLTGFYFFKKNGAPKYY